MYINKPYVSCGKPFNEECCLFNEGWRKPFLVCHPLYQNNIMDANCICDCYVIKFLASREMYMVYIWNNEMSVE